MTIYMDDYFIKCDADICGWSQKTTTLFRPMGWLELGIGHVVIYVLIGAVLVTNTIDAGLSHRVECVVSVKQMALFFQRQ